MKMKLKVLTLYLSEWPCHHSQLQSRWWETLALYFQWRSFCLATPFQGWHGSNWEWLWHEHLVTWRAIQLTLRGLWWKCRWTHRADPCVLPLACASSWLCIFIRILDVPQKSFADRSPWEWLHGQSNRRKGKSCICLSLPGFWSFVWSYPTKPQVLLLMCRREKPSYLGSFSRRKNRGI